MTRCALCDYLYPRKPEENTSEYHICAICEVRTTRDLRQALLQGQRVPAFIMDSD